MFSKLKSEVKTTSEAIELLELETENKYSLSVWQFS